MALTPKLGVRLMASNDTQKEVVFNEAAVIFDTMTTRSAINRTNTPPGSPAQGATYIVGTSPTGAWNGHANEIALYFNGWRFFTPFQKMKFFNETASTFWTYSGSGWAQDPAGTPSTLDDLTNVGISAPADGAVLTFDLASNKWLARTPAGVPHLDQLGDVDLGTLGEGQVLTWNVALNKWVNAAPAGGSGGAASLADLGDVAWSGQPDTGQVLVWNGTKAQFQTFSFPSTSLDDLDDVFVSDPVPNDALVWNGAAWVPSAVGINYSFVGMVDGPQTFEGFANCFLAVDATETKLEFRSLSELIEGLESFRLQDLNDVADPVDTDVGKVLQLQKTAGSFHYAYTAPVNYSIPAWAGATQVTDRILSLKFNGFVITEAGDGNLIVTNRNVLEFRGDNTPFEGEVNAINFTGSMVNVTRIDDVVTVDIDTPTIVGELGDLSDVDLETQSPVDGNVLKYNALTQKWVPGVGGGGGAPIESEYVPATYELGPFAPPTAAMFPSRLNAASADVTTIVARGLVVTAGPQASGIKHGVVYRDLAYAEEPWTVTARLVPSSFAVAGHAGGIVVMRSFNNSFVFLALGNSNSDTQDVLRLGWVNTSGVETILTTEPNEYNWLRLGFDGNTIRAWVSSDGILWQTFGAVVDPAATLGGVPNRIGITNRSNATHDGSCGTLVTYWDDPDFPAVARIQQGVVSLGINALTDVDTDTVPPTDGQALIWSEAGGKWLPGEGGGSADYPPFDGNGGKMLSVKGDESGVEWAAGALRGLSDVDVSEEPEAGQALVYDTVSDKWKPGTVEASISGGDGPGQHLFWRVYVTSGRGQLSIAEIQMRAQEGGPDQCTGGVVTQSSVIDGNASFSGAKAFDDNPSSWWVASSSSYPQWVSYQFTSPVEVRQVLIRSRADGAYYQGPLVFRLDYSDDGSTWTTGFTATTTDDWGVGEERLFNANYPPVTLFIPAVAGNAGKLLALSSGADALVWTPRTVGGAFKGPYGLTPGVRTITFDSNVLPPDFVFDRAGSRITNQPDPGAGTLKAYSFPDIGDSQATYFTFNVDVPVGGGTFLIRYKCSSEGPDKFRLNIDGGTWLIERGGLDTAFVEFTTPISAGPHTIMCRFSKDATQSPYDDTIYISKIAVSALVPATYTAGDTVTYGASNELTYLCLVSNTLQIPGTGSAWRLIGGAPFDVPAFHAGTMVNGETLLSFVAVRAFYLPAGATLSRAVAGYAATGTAVLSVRKNGSEFATITFTAGTNGVFTQASAASFAAGDLLQLIAPATADTTLADVAVTLAGALS